MPLLLPTECKARAALASLKTRLPPLLACIVRATETPDLLSTWDMSSALLIWWLSEAASPPQPDILYAKVVYAHLQPK